jgi:uncharacterized membrane protein YqjE
MSDAGQEKPKGLFASLKALGDSLISAVQTRLEILSVELQEEKWRLVELLVLTAAAIFFSVVAVVVVTIAIVMLVSEEVRPYVLLAFSLLYIMAAVISFRGIRDRLKNRPMPFAGTISELKKDRECLKSRN